MQKPISERPSWTELSIRERNILFLRGIEKILGMPEGKTWVDVRKEFSDEQVKEIHGLFGFFWPLDTDLYCLLPKSDDRLRAVYTGVIDPRTTPDIIYGMLPYFDEIIVQNPFMNPWRLRPEYNPIILGRCAGIVWILDMPVEQDRRRRGLITLEASG